MRKLSKKNIIPDTSSFDGGWTPLMRAVFLIDDGNLEVVKYLIDNGVDLEACDIDFGHTALASAADAGNQFAIDLLVRAGCNINHQDFDGQTALMTAVIEDRLKSVKTLVSHGACLKIKDNHGDTVIELAKLMERHSILDYFTNECIQSSRSI